MTDAKIPLLAGIRARWGREWYSELPDSIKPVRQSAGSQGPAPTDSDLSRKLLLGIHRCSRRYSLDFSIHMWQAAIAQRTEPTFRGSFTRTRKTPTLTTHDAMTCNPETVSQMMGDGHDDQLDGLEDQLDFDISELDGGADTDGEAEGEAPSTTSDRAGQANSEQRTLAVRPSQPKTSPAKPQTRPSAPVRKRAARGTGIKTIFPKQGIKNGHYSTDGKRWLYRVGNQSLALYPALEKRWSTPEKSPEPEQPAKKRQRRSAKGK